MGPLAVVFEAPRFNLVPRVIKVEEYVAVSVTDWRPPATHKIATEYVTAVAQCRNPGFLVAQALACGPAPAEAGATRPRAGMT